MIHSQILLEKNIRIRIKGIDAPEIRGKCQNEIELAQRSRDYLRKKIMNSRSVILKNISRGNYFRIIADVYVDEINIGDLLIKEKLAQKYTKNNKKNWCK